MIGFVVDDPENWLSKSQKEKVKLWFREHFTIDRDDYSDVLDRIHYREPTHKYKGVTVRKVENNEDLYRVAFSTTPPVDTVSTENLRDRLRAKLRQKVSGRTSLQTMGEDWKMYQKLLQSPAVKMIPAERLDLVLPNPDGERKQRSEYEQFQKVCPDPTLKEYFELCLQN